MQTQTRRNIATWQIAALVTVGAAGALALANKLSDLGVGAPPTVLDGEQRRYRWSLGEIAYTVKGQGEPLVLAHGIYAGASSYEFRRIFDLLARDFQVFAFDLLGFGHSDRPAINYTPAIYQGLIQDFVREVVGGTDQPVTILASSLTAAFAISAAAHQSGLFARLVLVEPTGIEHLAHEQKSLGRLLGNAILRSPLFGQGIYNAVCSRKSIRYFLHAQSSSNALLVSDDMIDTYYAMAHQPGGRFAVASFISGGLNTSVADTYAQLTQPILLCWGKDTTFTPLEQARAFRHSNARTDLRIFDCGGLPQEQVPEEFVNNVSTWLGAKQRFSNR